MKKFLVTLTAILLILSCFAGCKKADTNTPPITTVPLQPPADPKEFGINGIRFALTEDFTDYTHTPIAPDDTFRYANANWGLAGKEELKNAGNFQDLASFAAYYGEKTGCEVQVKDGFHTFTHIDNTLQETETHIYVFYESETSFWLVRAYCREDTSETYMEEMWKTATSATFN